MKRVPKILIVVVLAFLAIGCTNANTGEIAVKTKYGKVIEVHQPGVWFTNIGFGVDSATVSAKSYTKDVTVHTSTGDNARLKIQVKVNAELMKTNEAVIGYLNRFGLDETQRHQQRDSLIDGFVQTIARDAIVKHNAYDIYKAQDVVTKDMFDALKPFMEKEVFATLTSVQIVGSPDFDNDSIETAASNVVAAQKQKEAEQEGKLAAEIKKQKEEIENAIFASSPQAYQLAILEKRRQIIENLGRHHQGTFIIGGSELQKLLADK